MERRTLSVIVCLALILGCAQLKVQFRKKGERILEFPALVAKEYKCASRKLPFIQVEETELIPHRIKPGGRVNLRYVYVMCPSRISEIIQGKLYTRIHFRGKTIYNDVVQSELQPGRWVVDSFIRLPTRLDSGMYALEARFESRKGRFRVHSDFLVDGD
jgi:hypothetical protein